MENVTRELQELKKEQGPDRKLRKTDPCYPDYMRALEITEELKALRAEKKRVQEDFERQLIAANEKGFQSVPVQAVGGSKNGQSKTNFAEENSQVAHPNPGDHSERNTAAAASARDSSRGT